MIQILGVLTYQPDVGLEAIHVHKKVYPCICESLHTTGVICGDIDVVDTDGIDTEGLHESGICPALIDGHKRVICDQLVRYTYSCVSATA